MCKHRISSAIDPRDEGLSKTNKPEESPTKRRRLHRHAQETAYTKSHHKRVFANHDYKDHANDPIQPVGHRKGPIRFPSVLHRLLDEVEEMGLSHIVSWSSHGRSFVVYDQDAFVRYVMPQYFKQSHFSSFLRQLALYGFIRLSRDGHDHHAYYHEYFLRGREDLLLDHVKRTRIKGTEIRYTVDPDTEPDFLAMPPVGIPKEQQGQSSIAESIHSFVPDGLPPVFENDELSTVFQEEPVLSRPDGAFDEATQSNQAADAMPSTNSFGEKECKSITELSMVPEGQYIVREDQQKTDLQNGNEDVQQLDRLGVLSGLDVDKIASV